MALISWLRDAAHDPITPRAYKLKMLKIDTRGSSAMPIGLHELGVVSKALGIARACPKLHSKSRGDTVVQSLAEYEEELSRFARG
jgi:hypothetical protein